MKFSENIIDVNLDNIHPGNIHPGKIYKRKDPADNTIDYYLLATVAYNQYCLINLSSGNRFLNEPKNSVKESFGNHISQFTELPVGSKVTVEVKN